MGPAMRHEKFASADCYQLSLIITILIFAATIDKNYVVAQVLYSNA
jgi:hypothetical protein